MIDWEKVYDAGYGNGYKVGYKDGYADGRKDIQKEFKELRETMEIIKKHYILIEKNPRDNPNDLMIGRVMEANNEDHD